MSTVAESRPASRGIAERRAQRLAAEQQRKMARSAHAYVRGSTQRFYQWLGEGNAAALPDGPPVWICGDCHVGNLGPMTNHRGKVGIQIRDLDQTVIGNPAHDLIRLGLSLATAARGSNLPGVTTARMLEELMAGYQEALCAGWDPEDAAKPKSVRVVLRRALRRTWRDLARERIRDVEPTIPLGRRFWKLAAAERAELETLFAEEAVRAMVTGFHHRPDDAPIAMLDAAYWMKGCSSLGRLRFAVLLRVGGCGDTHGYSLIDVKEAARPDAPRAPSSGMPRDNAVRVVTGARALSPHLGKRMLPAVLQGRSVVLRELAPQDLKLEIERLTAEEAMLAARYLAGVVGHAHGRQMDDAARAAWCEELGRRWPKGLDAPFWLWSSVVDLVSAHEAAYLEHCRRFALSAA